MQSLRSGKFKRPEWCRPGGSRGYVVTHPLFWQIGKKGSGWVLTVPKGKEFESSVPRLFHWALSPDDPNFLKAAAIHDTLLEAGYRPAFADSQWFEAALSERAPALKAWLAYSGMRGRRFLQWLVCGKTNYGY